jgi:hypothetical protein
VDTGFRRYGWPHGWASPTLQNLFWICLVFKYQDFLSSVWNLDFAVRHSAQRTDVELGIFLIVDYCLGSCVALHTHGWYNFVSLICEADYEIIA